ncbi:inter-alpha-trypsin inhibitor [Polymixia lowei]
MLSSSLADVSVCQEEKDEGSGDAQRLQYFYDQAVATCHPFYYKGQGGNGNRFSSDKECMETCSPNATNLYPPAGEVCKLPADSGSCFGLLLMYYYNEQEKTCRIFHYSGCRGNGNRFGTREECQKTCMATSTRLGGPAGSEPNPDEVATSTGMIVGILGGVIFAVAVTMAIVFFVKESLQQVTPAVSSIAPEAEVSYMSKSCCVGASVTTFWF